MSKKYFLFIICTGFTFCMKAQQSLPKEEQDIRQTVTNFFQSLSDRDSVALKTHSMPDIVLLETGMIWNLDSLINRAIVQNTDPAFIRKNRFDFIGPAVIRNNTAWISYNLFSDVTKTGKQYSANWIESVVLIKDENKWKIKLLHSTLLKRS